ncbi:MAG: AAA family ATPase, partial [Myxococcota bacterium]
MRSVMLEELEQSIRESLSQYGTVDPEAPFANPSEHLELHLMRVRLWVMRHMRLYADRLFKADGTYSDRCVGPQEFARLMGFEPDRTDGDEWLDGLGVPTLDRIEGYLTQLESGMQGRLEATIRINRVGRLPAEAVRQGFGLRSEAFDLLMAAAGPRLSTDLSRLCAVAWCDYSVRQPTAGFIAELVAGTAPERTRELLGQLTRRSPLVEASLVELAENPRWQPHTPRLHALVVVPQRILDHLSGVGLHEAEVDGAVLHNSALPPGETVIPRSLFTAVQAGLESPRARVCLIGSSGSGRCTVVRSIAATHDLRVMEVDLGQALAGKPAHAVMETVHDLLREARLLRAVLFLNLDQFNFDEVGRQMGGRIANLGTALAAYQGPIFVATRDLNHNLHRLLDNLVEVRV